MAGPISRMADDYIKNKSVRVDPLRSLLDQGAEWAPDATEGDKARATEILRQNMGLAQKDIDIANTMIEAAKTPAKLTLGEKIGAVGEAGKDLLSGMVEDNSPNKLRRSIVAPLEGFATGLIEQSVDSNPLMLPAPVYLAQKLGKLPTMTQIGEKRIEPWLEEKLGQQGTPLEQTLKGAGKLLPSIIGSEAAIPRIAEQALPLITAKAPKAAEIMQKTVPAYLEKQGALIASSYGATEAPRLSEDRMGLPEYAAMWVLPDLAVKGVGKVLKAPFKMKAGNKTDSLLDQVDGDAAKLVNEQGAARGPEFDPITSEELPGQGKLPSQPGEPQASMPIEATSKPSVIITGDEFGKELSPPQLRKAAVEYARTYSEKSFKEPVINKETGIEIRIPMAGVKHVKAYSGDLRKVKLLYSLPQILEEGRYLGSEAPNKNMQFLKAVHRFETTVQIGDEPIRVVSVVRETKQGKFFYHYDLSEIKNEPAGNPGFSNSSTPSGATGSKEPAGYPGAFESKTDSTLTGSAGSSDINIPGKGPLSNLEGLDIDPAQLKDITGRQAGWRDIWRNMRDVFGEKFPEVKARILDPLEDAKGTWVDHQKALTDALYNDIVDGLGIKAGSRESALVQLYGEGGYREFHPAPQKALGNKPGNIAARERLMSPLQKKYGYDNVEFTGAGFEILKPFTEKDLIAAVGEKRAAELIKAEGWFRRQYDSLIDEVNAVRRQIYPDAEAKLEKIDAKIAEVKKDKTLDMEERRLKLEILQYQREHWMRGKIVPKRKDYFRHFREMDGAEGIKNLFDTPAQISPELAGMSMYTRPKSKFHGFMQKRGWGPYKADAVGGFLDYIPASTYAIHMDPQGAAFRQLKQELATTMNGNTGVNKFLEYLDYYANDVQGKTNFFDRNWQFLTDRKLFRVLDTLNSRIKSNMVLGNAGTMVSQVFNVPQGLAFAKQYSGPGLKRYTASVIERMKNPEKYAKTNPMAKSNFLKERYSGAIYRRFDTGAYKKVKNTAIVGMEDVDRFATEFIWNACYEKGLATKGVADPIRYADYNTRRLVAGRGVGEVPLMQKSKIVQLIAPFQVEVGNLWNVMGDMRVDKDYLGGLVILPLSLWLFNKGSEQIKGSSVAFDPMQAIMDGIKIANDDDDNKAYRIMGRLAGEVLSNVPLGQTAAAALFNEQQRKAFFGREDPTRFGLNVLVAKGLQDPLYKIFPPFGGSQIEKIKNSVQALSKGGSYTDSGVMRYPVEFDPVNFTKGVLFGPSGFRESKPYYDGGARPLSEKQTKEVEQGGQYSYDRLMTQRKTKREEEEEKKKNPSSSKSISNSKVNIKPNLSPK